MTWNELIDIEKDQPYFIQLMNFLDTELQSKTIYPKKEDWFQAFHLTPLESVKVVIIGQDPYHGKDQAHGLSFSVKTSKLPPSLKNIYKELQIDLQITPPITGDLTPWAKQGVLLMNTVLTVEESKPYSHQQKGWEIFTTKVIEVLSQRKNPIVFILWGNHARSYKKRVNNPNHLVIEGPHPSPLSAYHGFFGSKPFSKTNEFLEKHNVSPIDWRIK